MTDPAVEAAKRALPDNTFDPGHDDYSDTALAAANEALKPLRARHKPVPSLLRLGEQSCGGCYRNWPCPDARLIYPEDQLT